MAHETYRSFVHNELPPILGAIQGPIDSFVAEKGLKQSAKKQAIETGSLDGVTFMHCPALNDVEQHGARREVKRAQEALYILSDEEDSLETSIVRDQAEAVVWQAVVVESAKQAASAYAKDEPDKAALPVRMLQQGLTELYPIPDNETARTALSAFGSSIESASSCTQTDAKAKVDTVLEQYPFLQNNGDKAVDFNDEISRALKFKLKVKFLPAFGAARDAVGNISNDNIVAAVTEILPHVGLDGWTAVDIGDHRTGFNVNSKKSQVESGKRSSEITWAVFEKLMVHELGVHATRTQKSKELDDGAITAALPGAVNMEEALGVLFENIWSGENKVGRDHYRYLIGAYAAGAVDGQEHTISETFSFICDLKYVELVGIAVDGHKNIDSNKLIERSRSLMFEHVYRAFRGMPPGVVMTKDLSYFSVKKDIITFCNAFPGSADELYDILLMGKIDSLNHKQVAYIKDHQKA